MAETETTDPALDTLEPPAPPAPDLQGAIDYAQHLVAELQQQVADLTQKLARLRFELFKAQNPPPPQVVNGQMDE